VPNSGKSDPFVGSDFTYSDLSQQNPSDYDFTMISPSVKVGDEDCWQIAGKPHTESVRDETGYSQTELWVSKSKLIVVQLKATLVKDGKTKYLKASDIRQVDGVWSPFKLQMRTLQGSKLVSETLLEVLSLKNDTPEVSDRDFTQERLSRGI
jgi:Outer membrane lipoprotein-sorting protein